MIKIPRTGEESARQLAAVREFEFELNRELYELKAAVLAGELKAAELEQRIAELEHAGEQNA